MLIAVDTNIPIDLASSVEDVTDPLAVIRHRTKAARLIASPTVNLELAYLSEFADEPGPPPFLIMLAATSFAAARAAMPELHSLIPTDSLAT